MRVLSVIPSDAVVRTVHRGPVTMNQCASVWPVVLALIVVGCSGKAETAGGEALASPPVRSGSSAARTLTTSVPAPIGQAEALAEDVQTDLAQNAWPAAEGRLSELRSLGEELDSAGVPQAKQSAYRRAVDSLGAATTRRSRSDALTAGNHVSRIVADIMADYPTKVPVEVVYMDVAGRDVLYAAQQGRWSSVADPVAELGRSYAAVQADVRARNPALDQLVTSEIAQLQHAVASRARDRATSLAQALLEDVDRIEQTF
jgi:hypothetical protein